ncbi:MAG TPA: hypothetical protein VFL83_15345 [Anaeromyxobacter sp.]|nr:hypothetical protein [Anaeromyxobacter sp.]
MHLIPVLLVLISAPSDPIDGVFVGCTVTHDDQSPGSYFVRSAAYPNLGNDIDTGKIVVQATNGSGGNLTISARGNGPDEAIVELFNASTGASASGAFTAVFYLRL